MEKIEMRKTRRNLLASFACTALMACLPAPADDRKSPAGGEGRAWVIVELFTSQGCSSCPPADRLLRRLAAEEGSGVVPLSFHVDYWNYIGWTDPFSSAAWSERQSRYARRAFGTGRVYTPQVVVDGEAEGVGSNESRLREAIREARRRPAAGAVEVEVDPGTGTELLVLEIGARVREDRSPATRSPATRAGEEWDVMVAVFEDDLVTAVPRGENSGRKLENSRVVRWLEKAFSLPARAGAEKTGRLEIEVAEGWKREKLGVAVFLQDPESMGVHGAAVASLAR
jgi:hypothetical protein